MVFSSDEIFKLVQYIWDTVLEIDVTSSDAALQPDSADGFLTGYVHVTGEWVGTMALSCPKGLARLAASTLLGIDRQEVSDDDMLDTVGELTNMVAGNLKGLIEGSCQISVPEVTQGLGRQLFPPGSLLLERVTFESGGQPFEVMLVEGVVAAGK